MTSLDGLFGGTGDSVAVIDGDLRVIYWNEASRELFGYSSEEAVGKTCHDLLGGFDERGGLLCGPEGSLLNCAKRGERLHNFNMLARRKDGRPVSLDVSTIYIANVGEHRNVVVHLFRSIDNLKRTQWMIDEMISLAVKEAPAAPLTPELAESLTPELTPREREVLKLLSRGLAAKAI